MKRDFSLGDVQVSLTPMERFEEFLQSRGKRMTKQRRTIVEQVFSHHEHFDADELMAELADEVGESASARATVYRSLQLLVDAGLLRAMTLGGRQVYEHDYGYPQHDHLHCTECDKLVEFQSDEIAEIRAAAAREYGFRATGHRFIVTGVCSDCQMKQHRPRRPLDLV